MNQDLTFMGNQFDEILEIIDNARTRAMRAVNAELINMYWEIGAYISQKVEADGWGKSVVTEFSEFLRHRYPASKGFSAQNIWRMKQFYETYRGNEKLSPLVREISWTNNLLILTGCKTDEAREFYLRLCAANNYSKRELDRQISSMLFERTMLSDTKNKELLTRSGGLVALRDAYVFELEELEAAKEDLEIKIANEKIAKPRISPEFVTFLLHKFRKLDVRQQSHRKMLIDAFVNAIYLYDDKLVLTFNYKDGTRTITLDDVKGAAKANTGSDLDCRGAPNNRDTPLGCPGY